MSDYFELIQPGTLVSKHFTFGELTVTDHPQFIDQQSHPPFYVRSNLAHLAADLLEPAHDLIGRMHVTSGYRCPELNAVLPGHSKTSRHMDGLAADVFPLDMEIHEAYDRLAHSNLPIDQLIWEYGRWIHIGAPLQSAKPRGQRLAIWEPGHYETWSPTDPRFRVA